MASRARTLPARLAESPADRLVPPAAALGELRTVEVPAGTIAYCERGAGPPIVFVHGVGVNADLWQGVVPRLEGARCLAPDLPHGSHSFPLRDGTDLSLFGLARIVADFLEALDLSDVTIVANDTGGAVSQALVGRWPERIGRLVLTSCDAFDKFPPTPQRYLLWAARSPLAMWLVAWTVQFRFVQRLPTAYGFVTQRPMPDDLMRSFTEPVRRVAGVRRDLARLLRAVSTRDTYEAAERLRGFDRPALVLWGDRDRIFPHEHGRRLAELLPQGRYDTIYDSRTFVPVEQPAALAERVREFLGA